MRACSDDICAVLPLPPAPPHAASACFCCCCCCCCCWASCAICSELTLAVTVGGAAIGFCASPAVIAGAGFAGAGTAAGLEGVGGTGLGGGAFARVLPYLYTWNIAAKTSIIIPI